MQFNKKQGKFLIETIQAWKSENFISHEDADKLTQSFSIRPFDWGKLAKYSFWISIICIFIAVSAILADELIINLIETLFHSSGIVPCIFFIVLSFLTYSFALKRRQKHPQKTFSNEAIFFIGILLTAAAVAYLGKAIDTGSGHYSLLFLLSSLIYSILAFWFPSKLAWIFSLLSLGFWFGTETGYLSGGGAYYLGMNFPLRFVCFSLVLILLSILLYRTQKLSQFAHPTKIMALLYLFISLWILSIFGNYGDMHHWWYNSTQSELLIWGIVFAVVALVSIVYGLKFDDASARGFGITFLFLNLYTKYFEYFWKDTHKAIFFIVLAISFWLVGRYAEKIWNLEFGIWNLEFGIWNSLKIKSIMTNNININCSNWFKFIFILLTIFIFICLFNFFIMVSLIGCGYDSSRIQGCIKISHYIYILLFIFIIGLGYISSKYDPLPKKYILCSIYNILFSTVVLVFHWSLVPSTTSVKYTLLFLLFTFSGICLFQIKNYNKQCR